MKTYTTEGIVLKRTNFGEADKILTIYSRHFGKIKVLARGVRKITSRKGGNLELFNWVRIFVAKGRNLDLVTEVETVNSFRNWRKDLGKVALAYHFCELADQLTAENAPNDEIFRLLSESFIRLLDGSVSMVDFEREILEKTGFWPVGKEADRVDIEAYIERIIDKKLRSKKIFESSL